MASVCIFQISVRINIGFYISYVLLLEVQNDLLLNNYISILTYLLYVLCFMLCFMLHKSNKSLQDEIHMYYISV